MKTRPIAEPLHISVAVTLIEIAHTIVTNRGFVMGMVFASPVIILACGV